MNLGRSDMHRLSPGSALLTTHCPPGFLALSVERVGLFSLWTICKRFYRCKLVFVGSKNLLFFNFSMSNAALHNFLVLRFEVNLVLPNVVVVVVVVVVPKCREDE